jgi:Uri superfamily endonuclease
MKGTYLLVMTLPKDISIQVGKLGLVHFKKGCYAYIGSALNGLEQRIERHLRKQKKIHWHIDYFLPFSEVVEIFYTENIRREECRIAQVLQRKVKHVQGFGCSDCSCESHLFNGSYRDILRLIDSLDMKPFPLHTNP